MIKIVANHPSSTASGPHSPKGEGFFTPQGIVSQINPKVKEKKDLSVDKSFSGFRVHNRCNAIILLQDFFKLSKIFLSPSEKSS